MKTALITGGCGFVGRHFTVDLVRRGYDVTIIDDLSTGLHPDIWPSVCKLEGDICFLQMDARDYFRTATESFDLIIHLAAVVGGRMTIEGDPLKVATDLAIDAMFFNWLPKIHPAPRKVMYFSSSAAYPIQLQTRESRTLLTESMIDFNRDIGLPDMTYGWSKLSGEFLAGHCVQKYGLDVLIYRPFSGYGEDQDQSYPFPRIVRRVIDREDPLIVWGSGEQVRDFIHIDDVVEIAYQSLDQLRPGEPMNLSSGIGTNFYQLITKCSEIAGVDIEIRNDPSKPEGVFYRVGDNGRQSEFYALTVSLEKGIERTMEFQRNNPDFGMSL